MTNEEAIRCLSVHSSTNGSGLCTDEQHYEAKQMGIKALEQTTWVPVSERLPEYRTEVLTCSSGGYIEIQSLEDAYGGYWENQKGDWSDFDEIIAWMPLPPSYQGERYDVR